MNKIKETTKCIINGSPLTEKEIEKLEIIFKYNF
jgi:hypothetical protein